MEYNIRVYKPELKQEEGKINNLKGFATITFDDAFCVKSIAIKESSKGNLYLDMPRYRDYETGEYVPFYRFTDKEFQKEVLDTVREAYENMTETKMDCKHREYHRGIIYLSGRDWCSPILSDGTFYQWIVFPVLCQYLSREDSWFYRNRFFCTKAK